MTLCVEGLEKCFDIWFKKKRMLECGTRCLKISFIGPGIKIVKRRKRVVVTEDSLPSSLTVLINIRFYIPLLTARVAPSSTL
jgi:hypothetical protein